jgi:hypothetical protein
MAVPLELLNKIAEYEKQGGTPEQIISGLAESKNYPDIATKVQGYLKAGGSPSDILQGIKDSPTETIPKIPSPAEQTGQFIKDTASTVGETALNIPGSALGVAKGMGQALIHPVDTISNLGSVAAGLGQKVVGNEQGEYVPAGQAFLDMLKNRYGGTEQIGNTIRTDPVGFLLDLSTIASGTGGAMKMIPGLGKAGEVIKTVGQAVEPWNASKSVALAGAKAVPESWLDRWYQSAVKFPTGNKMSLDKRNAASKAAREQGVWPTEGGIAKVEDRLTALNAEIDNIISPASAAGGVLDTDKVLNGLSELRKKYSNDPNRGPYLKEIDDLEQAFRTDRGKSMTVSEAQEMKKYIYGKRESSYLEKSHKDLNIEYDQGVAYNIKEGLAEMYPELSTLNAEESALIPLKQALNQAVKRLQNKDLTDLATGAYAAAGGAKVGLIKYITDLPSVKAGLAIALTRARAMGRVNQTMTTLRQTMGEAGKSYDWMKDMGKQP